MEIEQALKGRGISAADAMKFFGKSGIKVQEAKAVKVKGEDGKTRDGFETDKAALSEDHVIGARDYGKSVTIVTIDGKRHEAKK